MKKNQSKSKSKVEERKSVANQCDYSRSNGKCGRALCENFGKLCPGRSCEDWKCDAEGEVEEVKVEGEGEQRKFISRCDGMRKDGTCGNGCSDNHNKKCRGVKCPDRFQHAVAVVSTSQPSQPLNPLNYRDRVSEAYGRIETAKDNLLRECVKFGALLTEVGYYLGESRGGKHENGGLKAWLEENCPEVNYDTACGYKALATKCVKMLGGGSQAVAVLQDKTEVVPPGEEEAVEVESKFIEKRDELFNEVKSRRELEQTYFKFMASEGKGKRGRKKGQSAAAGSETSVRAETAAERAAKAEVEMRELIGKLGAFLTRGGKVQMLTQQARDDFHRALVDYAATLAEMM